LRCSYCDTKYAYKKKYDLTIEEILTKIKSYFPISLVEVTGGEPLLQDETYLLFATLLKNRYKVLLETNGSILLDKVPSDVVKIVDIKTPSSKMADKVVWKNVDLLNPKDEVKFVLSDRTDFEWAIAKIVEYDLLKHTILFSPVESKLAPKTLAKWILESKMPIRLQLQLHKIIWGKRRGV
jgi:7-carboxy-7-deazaguanine synthase